MSKLKAEIAVTVSGAPQRSVICSILEKFVEYARKELVGHDGISAMELKVTDPDGMEHKVAL